MCDSALNSLWHNDAIWWHRSRAPSHHLNQCWLIVKVMWHVHEDNFTGNAKDIYPWYELENYSFKTTTTSHKDIWIKYLNCYHHTICMGPLLHSLHLFHFVAAVTHKRLCYANELFKQLIVICYVCLLAYIILHVLNKRAGPSSI